MSQLTPIQEIFLLNISVNHGQLVSGPNVQQEKFAKINEFLQDNNLTNWEIAWGPAVFVAIENDSADNVIYVAKDKNSPRYFLAAAGTNPDSVVDWIEDIAVGMTVQWPFTIDKGVQVAIGSQAALDLVITLTAQACVNGVPTGNDITLGTYLQQTFGHQLASSAKFMVGGHSLGGALAPLLALWLAETRETWDPNKAISELSCWPSAGPTVGTQGFKTYYDNRVPLTTRIHNTMDVVPHAWNAADLAAIDTLFNPTIPNSDCTDWLVARAEKKVNGINYVQVGTTDYPLNGQVNKSLVKFYLPPGVNFGLQLDYQHVKAYYDMLLLDYTFDFMLDASEMERIAYWMGAAAGAKAHAADVAEANANAAPPVTTPA